MKQTIQITLEWKQAPKGDSAPCHLCDFKHFSPLKQPCIDCIRMDVDYTKGYFPTIVSSEIIQKSDES